MKIADINTPQDAVKFCHEIANANITALNGLMDKFPANVKAELLSLRDSLNANLAKLPPLEVPAAQEASWAFNSLVSAIVNSQEYIAGLMDRLSKLGTTLNDTITAKNSLDEQISKGELLTKAQVKTLVDASKDEGAKSILPQVIAMRRESLALNGLPDPGDDVLGLPAADYKTKFDLAVKNVASLKAKGMVLGGKGDAWVKETAWMPETAFAGRMTTIEELVPSLKAPAIDPLLGNKGDDKKTDADAGTRRVSFA